MEKPEIVNGDSEVSYEEVLSKFQVERQIDSSITDTANVMISASYLEEGKDILVAAREKLLKEDPRELFLGCLKHIVSQIRSAEVAKKYFWFEQLDALGIRGLGIHVDDLELIGKDSKNIFRAEPKWDRIKEHIDKVVLGKSFIEQIAVPSDKELWGDEFPLRMSACDASQHPFKLRIPVFNTYFSTPIVVNNAAGIIKERRDDKPEWVKVVVPKNTQDFENWVIIGHKDFDELEENDYQWATRSAMDVGQYFVEETYLLSYGGLSKKPDIHFRDGRIFPMDKAANCKIQNRHGQLTREAIWRMCTTLKKARELGIIFCGASKLVELKVFSIVIDWYIREVMKDKKWGVSRHVLTDSEMSRHILFNPEFKGDFKNTFVTCRIVRSFYTTSNYNSRTDAQFQNDLNGFSDIMHTRGLSAKQIVEEALKCQVAMFFVGHSTNSEYYTPRYEFAFYEEDRKDADEIVLKVLSALRLSAFEVDTDHLRTMDRPILMPIPLMYSHNLSKTMGEILAQEWKGRTYAEYIKLKKQQTPV